MSADTVDQKKLLVGWGLIGLAALTTIFCYVRDVRSGILGCFLIAVVGWSFVSAAKRKKEAVSPRRAYLYFIVLLILSFAGAMFFAHFFR